MQVHVAVSVLEDTQDNTLAVDMDEIEREIERRERKTLKFSVETLLREHVWTALTTFEGQPAKQLKEIFLQSSKKFKIGTLCSGSESVMDVLEAFPFQRTGQAEMLYPHTYSSDLLEEHSSRIHNICFEPFLVLHEVIFIFIYGIFMTS